jgi:cobalt-zinc-cadmium efflux system outer membrane protein
VNPAKRHARAARASAEIGIAEAGALTEGRSVRLQTALAWVDLYYAERRLAQLTLLDASLSDLQSTVSARLASGSARPSQALEPDQLRAQVNDRRAELTADVAKARASLARFTGDPNPEVAGAPPALMVDRTRLLAGVATLPSLRAMDAQTVAADADTQLARADKRPTGRSAPPMAAANPIMAIWYRLVFPSTCRSFRGGGKTRRSPLPPARRSGRDMTALLRNVRFWQHLKATLPTI